MFFYFYFFLFWGGGGEIDVNALMATGIEFQRVGPATENALEPFLFFFQGAYCLISEDRSNK